MLTARCLRRRRGNTASVFGRMPLAFDPPTCSDTPQPPHWPEGVSECARRYSNMRKEAILRSAVSSARICNQEKVPKFQTSAIRNSCAQMPSSRRLRHPYSYHPSDGTRLEPERRSPPMWGHSAAARKSPLAPECLVGSGGLEPPTRPLWAKLYPGRFRRIRHLTKSTKLVHDCGSGPDQSVQQFRRCGCIHPVVMRASRTVPGRV